MTNVVMMGMGEPLNNFEPVVDAMEIMLDDYAYGLSRRRVTLSTSGVVPKIRKLAERLPVALAVSLHAPNDEIRSRIMPINHAYPIAELLAACREYLEVAPRDFITFEYVMLEGVNDAPDHANELARLLKKVPSKVNLIPFNPFPDSGFERTDMARVKRFQQILLDAGFVATIRKTRGEDIDAACGQLGRAGGQPHEEKDRPHPLTPGTLMRLALAAPALKRLIAVGAVAVVAACASTSSTESRPVTDSGAVDGRRRAEVHTSLAGEYYQRGNFAVALAEARPAIRTIPPTFPAYNTQALVVHGAAQDWPGARGLRRTRVQAPAQQSRSAQQLRLVPVPPVT